MGWDKMYSSINTAGSHGGRHWEVPGRFVRLLTAVLAMGRLSLGIMLSATKDDERIGVRVRLMPEATCSTCLGSCSALLSCESVRHMKERYEVFV